MTICTITALPLPPDRWRATKGLRLSASVGTSDRSIFASSGPTIQGRRCAPVGIASLYGTEAAADYADRAL